MPEPASPIRIALADDQPLVLRGLGLLLREFSDLELMLTAADGRSLLALLAQHAVDIIISDIRMPGGSGIELVRTLRARGDATPVILLTTFADPEGFQAAVDAGAQGFLLKDAAPDDLHAAIMRVASGHTLLEPISLEPLRRIHASTDALPDDASRITPREADILRLVAAGQSNKEIARVLHLSEGTVKNHMTAILARLGCRDRTHAVLTAITLRLI